MATLLDPQEREVLDTKFATLRIEAKEASESASKFKDTTTRITTKALEIAEQDAAYTERSSKFQTQLLGEIIELRGDLHEKSSSPFASLIEPVKRIFSPETSIEGTAAKLRGKQRTVDLQKRQDAINATASRSKLLVLEAEDKQARAELAGEAADVTSIATEIAAQQQQMTSREKFRSDLMLHGSVEEMQVGVDKGILSSRDMKNAIQAQTSSEVTAATAAVKLEIARHTQTGNELSNLEDLDTAVELGFSAVAVERAKRNRAQQERSENQLLAQTAERTLTADELIAEADTGNNPELTPERAKRVNKKNEAADAKLDAEKSQANALSLQVTQAEEGLWLQTQTTESELVPLLAAIKEHEASGEGDFQWQTRDGKPLPLQFVTATDVQKQLTIQKQVSLQGSKTQVVMETTQVSISRDVKQLALITNTPMPEGATDESVLDAIVQGKGLHSLPTESNAAVATAQANLAFTNSPEYINNPELQMEDRIKGAEALSKATAVARDSAVAGLPTAEQQRAMMNYFNDFGVFRDQNDAIVNNINKFDTIVGLPAYDKVSKIVTEFVNGISKNKRTSSAADKLDAIREQFATTPLTEAEQSGIALREGTAKGQNALQKEMAAAIYFQPIISTYAKAFEELGFSSFSQEILNGRRGYNTAGEFQESVLFEQMAQQFPDVPFTDLSAIVRRLSSTAYSDYYETKTALQPDIVAGYNSILFENQPDTWTAANIIKRMQDGSLTLQTARRDVSAAQAAPLF